MAVGPRGTFNRLTDAINRHDAQAAAEVFAEDALVWEPSYDEPRRGREAVRRGFEELLAKLPDLQVTVETVMTDGDRVLHEVTFRATFSERPVEFRKCSVSRLRADGRLAEGRVYFDRLTLLRQLGLAADVQ